MIQKPASVVCGLTIMMALVAGGCRTSDAPSLNELERVKTATFSIVLLSASEALHQGKGSFTIEFRAVSDNHLVDVGEVKGSTSMSMAGTPMFGAIDIQKTTVPGRYLVNSDFSMAGRWRLTIEWNGPAGQGSVTFAGAVQ